MFSENLLVLLVVITFGIGYAVLMNHLSGARYLLFNHIIQTYRVLRFWLDKTP